MEYKYRHRLGVTEIKERTNELYDSLMGGFVSTGGLVSRGRRPGAIASMIGKKSQTVAQYRANVQSTASRIISPEDMLTWMMKRDESIARRFFGGSIMRRMLEDGPTATKSEEFLTKLAVSEPVYDIYDADGSLLDSVCHRAHAQQIADWIDGSVVQYCGPVYDLPAESLLKHRFRKLMKLGRVSVEEVCQAFDRCPYSLLGYWTEFFRDKKVPDERILARLEAQAYGFESEAA